MNTTKTLAAIVMFAAVLGMVSFGSAFAVQEKTSYCHYDVVYVLDEFDQPTEEIDEEASSWIVITPSSSAKGHEKHGDNTVDNEDEAFWCVTNQDGSVTAPA